MKIFLAIQGNILNFYVYFKSEIYNCRENYLEFVWKLKYEHLCVYTFGFKLVDVWVK